MVQANDIRNLRTSAPDYAEGELRKTELRRLRAERDPLFLATADLEPIFRWKLAGQYGRNAKLRATNTDAACRAVTCAALSVTDDDSDYEVELRLKLLTALRGV